MTHKNEVLMKTHLIVDSQEDAYDVLWYGRINDVEPKLNERGLPTFVAVTNSGRMETATADFMGFIRSVERFTHPRGRGAHTYDIARIYIKTVTDEEYHLATVEHEHIRHYAPMYDWVPID